jgi:hypothetical protein
MRSNAILPGQRGRIIACAIGLVMSAGEVASAERQVVVNGKEIAGVELEKLDRADCRPIPNGNYWLNRRSGTWGYAGERMVQGRIGDGCRVKQRSLSKSRSLDSAGSAPPSVRSVPDDVVKREEPITSTSPLLRAPGSDPGKP